MINPVSMTIGANHSRAQMNIFVVDPSRLDTIRADGSVAVTLVTRIALRFADQVHEDFSVAGESRRVIRNLGDLRFGCIIIGIRTVTDP